MKARLCLLAFLMPCVARAWGPVVEGGGVVTLTTRAGGAEGTVAFSNLVGPRTLVGLEIGERFNHELGFEFSRATGTGETGGVTVPVYVQTLAGRYTFSIDFRGKRGFTPLVAVGLAVGQAQVEASTSQARALWLALHGAVGVRYTFENGLGLKLQVAASSYGGFLGLQPSLAASWRF